METFLWFMLEAFGAATLVGLLIWWSWPKSPKPNPPPQSPPTAKDSE